MIFQDKKNKSNNTEEISVASKKNVKNVKPSFSYKMTEKTVRLGNDKSNVVVLNVLDGKNKIDIKKELEAKYKVTILGIRIINSPKKPVFNRGYHGTKGGGKKAYITLKKGDSIVLA